MNKIITTVMASLLLVSIHSYAADAAAPKASDCEAKAVSKAGKPLAGAAKAASIKKCEKDSGAPDAKAADAKTACEAKALSKDGKPLHGAAKNASVKKCLADAK